jgi:hypothetical protein
MKKIFFLAGLFIFPSLCFAADYYAEYSFAEVSEIDNAEIHGGNGWSYGFVEHWSKTDVQDRINRDKQSESAARIVAAEYMTRMLGASADKRIFVIDTSIKYGPWGWLFIKINENEYVVFFTGS